MRDNLEKLIKIVYRKWKSRQPRIGEHPQEEDLVCFLENRLSKEESEPIKIHLLSCDICSEKVALNLGIDISTAKDVPEGLLARLKNIVDSECRVSLLEIILKAKEKILELISTTGDVLVGQELIPAPILRSRSIKDFKDEVTILKDFKDVRVEIKIEAKGSLEFNVIIAVKDKVTQKMLKDLRVTLMKEDLELESYLADFGAMTFEHVLLGKYRLEVSTLESKIASVLLDIQI